MAPLDILSHLCKKIPHGVPILLFQGYYRKSTHRPPEDTETPLCFRKFKMLQFSCNTCHIVPLIVRIKINQLHYICAMLRYRNKVQDKIRSLSFSSGV